MKRIVCKAMVKPLRISMICKLMIGLSSLLMIGCGSNNGTATPESDTTANDLATSSQTVRDSYVMEEMILPHESIFYETVTNDILYYLNYIPSGQGAVPVEEAAVCSIEITPGQAVPAETPFVLDANLIPGRIATDGNGTVYLLSSRYEGDGADSRLTDMFLTKIDADGTASAPFSILESLNAEGSAYVTAFEVDVNGNLCLASDGTLTIMESDGSLIGQLNSSGPITNLCRDSAGTLYAVWSQSGTKMIAKVDSKAQILTSQRELSLQGLLIGAGQGSEGQLIFATEIGLFDYDWEAKTLTERFQWLDMDQLVDSYEQIFSLSDGRILLVSRPGDQWGGSSRLTIIRPRRADEPVAEPTPTTAVPAPAESTESSVSEEELPLSLEDTGNLTLGAVRLEPAIKEAVIAFNQSHPNSRIEVIEYGTDDYQSGITQLNADIASGNCPDILILPPHQFSMDLYAAMGLLLDLNPYINADSSIVRADLQENILKAYEEEGKLFCLPISFFVDSLTAKTAYLNGRTSWTLDEMIACADEINQDTNLFMDPRKSAVLDLCMKANADNIVNWNDPEGSGFQRDFFIKMLEFSNRFMPDEQVTEEMLAERYFSGEIVIRREYASLYSIQLNPFNEPSSYIGYPSETGSGSLAETYSGLAVSSSCPAMGTAWAFISSLLTEEVQSSPQMQGYPILKSSLEAIIEYSKNNGGMMGTSTADGEHMETIEYEGSTEEELQIFQSLIDNVEKSVSWDQQISLIFAEESGAYFNGSKTAEEVADVVENRINIYVNEKR